ncbi:hypothetical protein H4Q26_002101 [Puccinia striiformis f. sp. tritici PST-130]|nr:hypothetical protein H4Q26_002101 [Puccinia striiformis f. sp. tritici PST-130]
MKSASMPDPVNYSVQRRGKPYQQMSVDSPRNRQWGNKIQVKPGVLEAVPSVKSHVTPHWNSEATNFWSFLDHQARGSCFTPFGDIYGWRRWDERYPKGVQGLRFVLTGSLKKTLIPPDNRNDNSLLKFGCHDLIELYYLSDKMHDCYGNLRSPAVLRKSSPPFAILQTITRITIDFSEEWRKAEY